MGNNPYFKRMINDDEFLQRVISFLEENKLAETTFGLKAVNDGNFVKRLKNGGSVTIRMANKIISFMDEYVKSAA